MGKLSLLLGERKVKLLLIFNFNQNHFLTMQLWKSAAVGLLAITMTGPWVGLSSSLEKNKTDLQCTDRLNQEKYQAIMTICYTGEKIPPLPFSPGLMLNGGLERRGKMLGWWQVLEVSLTSHQELAGSSGASTHGSMMKIQL